MELACDVYLTNKFLIQQLCQRFEITPIFVWQPVPCYKYDLKHHLFEYPPDLKYAQERFYPMIRKLLDNQPNQANFVWCADIQQDLTEPLYVDVHHYTAAFSKILAGYIVQTCLDRHLLASHLGPKSPVSRLGRVTGGGRVLR
jgi:hypothetical protein